MAAPAGMVAHAYLSSDDLDLPAAQTESMMNVADVAYAGVRMKVVDSWAAVDT